MPCWPGLADRTTAPLMTLGALAGAVALTAGRMGLQHHPARVLATLIAPLVIAISFHFLLALPDGRLTRPAARALVAFGYASALGTGIGLALAGRPFPLAAGAVIWPLAVLCALPCVRQRYLRATGRDAERMQWLGAGLVAAASISLICAVLHLLVGWPGPPRRWRPARRPRCRWPRSPRNGRRSARSGGRVFVQTLVAAGASAAVAVIYLIIVLGLGQGPNDDADRKILGLSMLAAALAAIAYLPVRGRLAASATRFVYGTREAPGEALSTFGSRMTRAVAMDELLLQLAESLRKTMRLDQRGNLHRRRRRAAACRVGPGRGRPVDRR